MTPETARGRLCQRDSRPPSPQPSGGASAGARKRLSVTDRGPCRVWGTEGPSPGCSWGSAPRCWLGPGLGGCTRSSHRRAGGPAGARAPGSGQRLFSAGHAAEDAARGRIGPAGRGRSEAAGGEGARGTRPQARGGGARAPRRRHLRAVPASGTREGAARALMRPVPEKRRRGGRRVTGGRGGGGPGQPAPVSPCGCPRLRLTVLGPHPAGRASVRLPDPTHAGAGRCVAAGGLSGKPRGLQ